MKSFKEYLGEMYVKKDGWTVDNLPNIIKTSKQNPNIIYKLTDDNYSRIGNFWLKAGKLAKITVANLNYDLANNKANLRSKSDVIYKYIATNLK